MKKILNKHIKRIILIFMIIMMCVNLSTVCADDVDLDDDEIINEEAINEVANIKESEPIINSRKCVVYDRKNNMVLYGKNENTKTAMASTTKIMTATVVLEKATELNKVITITAKAAGTGGSRLGLKTNDKITINDLLYGLMLRSR